MLYDTGDFFEGLDLKSFECLTEEIETREKYQKIKSTQNQCRRGSKKLKAVRKPLSIQLSKCLKNISIFESNMLFEYNNKNMVEANEWKKKMENELFIKETLEENILAIDEKLADIRFAEVENEDKIEDMQSEYNPGCIIWDHINNININDPSGYQSNKIMSVKGGVRNRFQKLVLSEYSKRRMNVHKELKEKFEKMQESPNNAKKVFGFLGEYLKDTFL